MGRSPAPRPPGCRRGRASSERQSARAPYTVGRYVATSKNIGIRRVFHHHAQKAIGIHMVFAHDDEQPYEFIWFLRLQHIFFLPYVCMISMQVSFEKCGIEKHTYELL